MIAPRLMRQPRGSNFWLLDTDPVKGRGMFVAPESRPREYDAWLLERFNACRHTDSDGHEVCYGIAQRINQILFDAHHGRAEVIAFGPYGADAAVVIEYLSGWTLEVEVR